MKKLITITFFLFFFLVITSVNADWCYQESANVSTSCGGLNTGVYSTSGSGDDGYMYVNYTKPAGATSDSLWNVKAVSGLPHGENKSINNFYDCFSQTPLQFKIYIASNSANSYVYGYCWDGYVWGLQYSSFTISTSGRSADFPSNMYDEDWDTNALYYSDLWYSATGGGGMFEEAMVWDIQPITIISPTNGSTYNLNNNTVNFNITTLADSNACRWSNNNGINNYTMINGSSKNFSASNSTMSQGSNSIIFYCNESSSGIWKSSTSVDISVDTINPKISIISPTNNTNSTKTNLNVNYTRSDTNLGSCWYSNDTYISNTTLTNCVNITTVTWTQGQHNVTIYVNDTFGNVNSSQVSFIIDSINPQISIKTPTNNTNSSNTNLNINYTRSDTNLGSCWWTNNSGVTNYSLSTCENITTVTWNEGISTVKIYANDTFGNVNSSQVTFTIDTTPPSMNIVYPLNQTYNINVSKLNYTYTETNPSKCWYSNSSGIWNSSINNLGTNWTNVITKEGSNTLILYCNDSAGNTNSANVTFFKDTIYPLISYGIGTNVNFANISKNFVYINTTWTEVNLANITFTLKNSTWSNSTTYTSSTYLINFTDIADGKYWYYVNITDLTNNKNSTSIYNITLDTILPLINIITPINGTSSSNVNLNVNYTASDVHLSSCKWSKSNGALNFSISCGTNITGQTWSQGQTTVTIWANDTYGNENNSQVVFTITTDTTHPNIQITNPTNNTNSSNTNLNVNYTVSDIHLSNCWYSNDTYSSNTSLGSGGVCTNITTVTWTEGNHNIIIWANDTFGNVNSSKVTFTIDSINPNIQITTPINGTNSTNVNLNVNFTRSDAHLSSCKWTNNSGVTNYSITNCNNLTTITWNQGLNNIKIYANDSAGNEDSSNVSFFIDSIAPSIIIFHPNWESFTTTNIPFNFSITDSGVGLSTCWWKNDTGVNMTIDCNTNFTFTQIAGTHNVYLWANDTLGNTRLVSEPYSITSPGLPSINLIYPITWLNNGTNVDFNFTAQETTNGILNCSLYGNWTGWALNQSNTTLMGTGLNYYNFKNNLSDGFYKWNAFCFEGTGVNSDWAFLNQTFGIDTINPKLTLTKPTNTTYTTNQLTLNYSATDLNRNICWYNINNGANISTSCNNISFTAGQGSSILRLFVNDSANNLNQTNVSFYVDSIHPSVSIDTDFADGSYLNYNTSVIFNVTITETNPSSCWYRYNSGANNYFTCGNNLTLNFSEGLHNINISANDTLNNIGSSQISFIPDVTYPIVSNIVIGTIIGLKSFSINSLETDTNLLSCKYTVYNILGFPEGVANKSYVCNSLVGDSLSNFGDYSITIYALDRAGNENSSNQTFTLPTGTYAPPGGGGDSIIINNPPSNVTLPNFCGDGVCNENFTYQGLWVPKNRYNCAADCPPYNFDEWIYRWSLYCFQKENYDKCEWFKLFNFKPSVAICGDNKCDSFEMVTCTEDCGDGFNLDTMFYNCGKDEGVCLYDTSFFYYLIIGILILILILSFVPVKYKNRTVKAYQYVQLSYKNRRRRR